jgi:hypothetical protein
VGPQALRLTPCFNKLTNYGVIPAKAGIHGRAKLNFGRFAVGMDPSFRWDDTILQELPVSGGEIR